VITARVRDDVGCAALQAHPPADLIHLLGGKLKFLVGGGAYSPVELAVLRGLGAAA
jgi:hypothetical protein